MDTRIDLDLAAARLEDRVDTWRQAGLDVGPVTWRDQGAGWPPVIRTDRADVRDADSIGVELRKGLQEASLVLFRGGWADLTYWSGWGSDDVVDEAPGWDDSLDIDAFEALLDRVTALFT